MMNIGGVEIRAPNSMGSKSGEKEPRFAHLLSGEVERTSPHAAAVAPARVSPMEERLARVETELAELKRQFDVLRKYFE